MRALPELPEKNYARTDAKVFAELLRGGFMAALAVCVAAQDARESLGPKDKPASAKSQEPHPLTALMSKLNSSLRPELRGKHPRVYVTEEGLAGLRERSRTTHRDLWQRALQQLRALKIEPPAPPAQERRVQNEVGIGAAEAALAYKIEGDKKYLEAAKEYLEAAVSYDIWGTLTTSRTLIWPPGICFTGWAGATICSITI